VLVRVTDLNDTCREAYIQFIAGLRFIATFPYVSNNQVLWGTATLPCEILVFKTAVIAATDLSVHGLKRTGRLWRSWYKPKMKSHKNIVQRARYSLPNSLLHADHSPQS